MSARRAIANVALALALAVAASGCVTTRNTFPPLGATAQPPGDANSRMVSFVIGALQDEGLESGVAVRPFRPLEGPLLAAAPREVIEVVLPDAPSNTWIVVYDLRSTEAAARAAEDHAAYVAAPLGGGVLYPPGTQFVLQVAGQHVLFFHWLPATSPDGRSATIAEALGRMGTPVDVPH